MKKININQLLKLSFSIIILLLFLSCYAYAEEGECISGNCVNGKGTFIPYDDNYNAKYVGEFKNGFYNGHGILTYSNDRKEIQKYVGQFKEDQYDGKGTLTLENGSKYVGEFKNSEFNGQGILTSRFKDTSIGQWKNGKLINGQVTEVYPTGNKYVSCLKNGNPDSQITIIYYNGDKYIGEYIEFNPSGQGTMTYSNGDKYVGQWKNGEINGQGSYTFANGMTYTSEWKNWKITGGGTLTFPNGIKITFYGWVIEIWEFIKEFSSLQFDFVQTIFSVYTLTILLFLLPVVNFTTLLHELGHGIPALLFTTKKVTLHIGFYEDPSIKTFKVSLGRLDIFFRKNITLWLLKGGLCKFEISELNFAKYLIIILGGLFSELSFLILFILLSYFLTINPYNTLNISIAGFLGGIISILKFKLILSIFMTKDVKIENLYYSDAHIILNYIKQIISSIKYGKFRKNYLDIIWLISINEYEKAINKFKLFDKNVIDKNLAFSVAYSSHFLNNYTETKEIINILENKFVLNLVEYSAIATILTLIKEFNESNRYLDKALNLEPQNSNVLTLKAYNHILLENYNDAIELYDLIIKDNENNFEILSLRGLAKIKTNKLEDGFEDLQKSLILNNKNSLIYKNFGIYYLEMNQCNEALENFDKAYELNKDDEIENYIKEVKEKLNPIDNMIQPQPSSNIDHNLTEI